MDIKDSYLHSSLGVVKSLSITADKLTYNLADIANTSKTITMPLATKSANGLLSKEDKTKIDNIKDVVKHYTLASDKYLKISLLDGVKSSEFMITGSSTTSVAKTCAFYSTYDPGGKVRSALKLIHKGVYEYYIDNPANPSVPVLYIKNYNQTSYINILSFSGTYCDVTEVDSIPDTAVKHTDENILATVKELSLITQLSDITAGNSTLPIYFKEGVPTPITVGLDGSLFATVGTNPTWTTDFRTLGWYKINNLYTYDSEAKLLYHHYIKIASLTTTPLVYSLRFKVFEDINYPQTGEWILRLNYKSTYSKCVSLSQIGPSNKLFKVYIDDKFDVYILSDIEWESSLRFCIEVNDANKNAVYTSNWEQTTTQPTNIIASIINNGVVRIAPDNTVLDNLNTNNLGYKQFFTSDYFKGALRGNADTTTKLLNARTLWGLSFDGTANISGAISNTGNITPSSSNAYSVGTSDLGYNRFYAKGSGKDIGLIAINTYDTEKPAKIGFIIGSGNTNRGIYDYTEEGWMMYRNTTTNIYFPNGNIGIGYNGASVPERLSVNGTTHTTKLKISSTVNEKHIEFSRGSAHSYPYNYITAPVGGIISILPNGVSTSSSNGILFSGDGIHPATTKGYSLGTSAKYWDKGYIGNIFMDSLIDYTNYPEAETFKMGLDVGTIHFKGGIADKGNSITWGYGNNTIADSGIYVTHNGSYGSKMYLATTNLWDEGPKVTLQLEPNGLVIAPRNTIKATGFVRNSSSNNYILLGGGGHKALSDFVLKTDILNDNLTTITKSLQVTTDWMDTGIVGDNLTSGTYIVLVNIDSSTLNIWGYTWSGTMSWFAGTTNDNESDEIYIHGAGHATSKEIYLRTLRTSQSSTGRLKLLIASNIAFTEAIDVTFKFKRII